MDEWLPIALALGLLGVLSVVVASRTRRAAGFVGGGTVALDDMTLFSERLKLVGRPDRIVRQGENFIPEEWKSAKRVSDGHKLQLGEFALGLTVASALIETIIGAIAAGQPADRFGRRLVLIAIAVLYFVSALGSGLAWDWSSFLFFRFLGGIGVGGASVVSPMYTLCGQ